MVGCLPGSGHAVPFEQLHPPSSTADRVATLPHLPHAVCRVWCSASCIHRSGLAYGSSDHDHLDPGTWPAVADNRSHGCVVFQTLMVVDAPPGRPEAAQAPLRGGLCGAGGRPSFWDDFYGGEGRASLWCRPAWRTVRRLRRRAAAAGSTYTQATISLPSGWNDPGWSIRTIHSPGRPASGASKPRP